MQILRRLDWSVLDWSEKTISFYTQRMGANLMKYYALLEVLLYVVILPKARRTELFNDDVLIHTVQNECVS